MFVFVIVFLFMLVPIRLPHLASSHVSSINASQYHELVLTSREYMREVLVIDPQWLVMYAPQFFRVADAKQASKRRREMKLDPIGVPKNPKDKREKDAWRLSARRMGGSRKKK